jgi:hypothetical protein
VTRRAKDLGRIVDQGELVCSGMEWNWRERTCLHCTERNQFQFVSGLRAGISSECKPVSVRFWLSYARHATLSSFTLALSSSFSVEKTEALLHVEIFSTHQDSNKAFALLLPLLTRCRRCRCRRGGRGERGLRS